MIEVRTQDVVLTPMLSLKFIYRTVCNLITIKDILCNVVHY